ncbi:MAG: hypothetical protein ABII79_04985 [bacterium]
MSRLKFILYIVLRVLVHTVTPILLLICVMFLSCSLRWRTVASVFNSEHHVVARLQASFAMTPYVLGIFLLKSGHEADGERELVRLIKRASKAQMYIVDNNVLFAATYDVSPGNFEWYFLLNLDKPPGKLKLWGTDTLAEVRQSAIDSSDQFVAAAYEIEDFSGLTLIRTSSLTGKSASERIFVLGVDSLSLSFSGSTSLLLDIHWQGGKTTSGLCLELPEPLWGSIAVPCEDTIDAKGARD